MTHIVSARAIRKPSPFVPTLFAFPDPAEVCVVIQNTSFRPTKAITLSVPDVSRPFPATALSLISVRQRKTLRTVMHEPDGTLKGAKIDLVTGEVTPHQYKDFFEQGPRARIDHNAPDWFASTILAGRRQLSWPVKRGEVNPSLLSV
jgi:hypothetical protein